MFESPILEAFFRILLAAALGMAIGAEQEHRRKSVGLRTYTLVALGSALFTVISVYGFEGRGAVYDPGRIASQIVVGIGFIGAGMIILRENKIEGLTTAASVWTTAGVGMAVGFGLYYIAAFATFVILSVILILSAIKKKNFSNGQELP